MWLKTESRLIDLSNIADIECRVNGLIFIDKARNFIVVERNSPEAAQALFEHVAAMLEAKE